MAYIQNYNYCDRCKAHGDFYEDHLLDITCGFYKVDKGYWKQFANEDEKIVCDECMFKDPRYIKVYGHHSSGA